MRGERVPRGDLFQVLRGLKKRFFFSLRLLFPFFSALFFFSATTLDSTFFSFPFFPPLKIELSFLSCKIAFSFRLHIHRSNSS